MPEETKKGKRKYIKYSQLIVLYILLKYSDENHLLTKKKVMQHINNEFGLYDIIPTRSVNGEYNGFTADQLDINKDTIISVTDYCSLLYTLQSDYDFDYNTTECYAIIKNCKKTDAKSLIVPSEIYVDGKIMPVMEIAPNAFSKCKSLTDIKIESFKLPQWIDKYNNPFDSEKVGKPAASSYMCIDGYAFNGCKKLTKISLPDNVVFTADAFNNSGLSSKVENIDGVNYFKENSDRWFACGITNSNKAIKNGVFKLNDNAVAITTYLFYGDGNIKEFLYNKSKLNFIADYTFENCENLEKVNNNSYENLSADEKEFIFCIQLNKVYHRCYRGTDQRYCCRYKKGDQVRKR